MAREKKAIDIQNWTWSIIVIIFLLDIILFSFVFLFPTPIISEIYIRMIIYSLSSALIVMIIVELFTLKLLTAVKMSEYSKKPRVFEFCFFFFSFLATFFTIFAAGLYNNPEGFLEYLQSSWYFMSFYGVAFACGWYHYILRLDY